ncbi:low affinity immunoglobulin gamma Fc region receptor II-a-like isoform X2 [Epinephelus moara]|uniref:low affinity immunoglobulin gamma Fc region receptor II-a-like isoform X2 n=1 Tax=Epinephelus moara TaxID=300413 RepID=UPI00214E3AC7|nr:low affinity immunoglobulin gamma Fc region receptor II-a-like isoform X2 [Epinephelus moara]
MEVTALCLTLLMNVLLLLCAHHQEVESAVLHVDPNRLQFFEYEPVTLHCEGPKGEELSCKSTNTLKSTGSSCTIKNVFPEDGGEYWCEGKGGGRRSNSVNITVTAGSVILESPALPVKEGDAVTLRCRNKTTSSTLTAEFFKDGRSKGSSSTGNMTVHHVSKSDEGLYKCSISGAGESPGSRLAVTGDHKETTPTSSSSTPWIVTTLLLLVLLMVVGALHLGKRYWNRASVEAGATGGDKGVYATVTRNRKKKDDDALASTPVYYTLGLDDTQQLGPGASTTTATPVPSAGTNPSLTDIAFYSTVQWPTG